MRTRAEHDKSRYEAYWVKIDHWVSTRTLIKWHWYGDSVSHWNIFLTRAHVGNMVNWARLYSQCWVHVFCYNSCQSSVPCGYVMSFVRKNNIWIISCTEIGMSYTQLKYFSVVLRRLSWRELFSSQDYMDDVHGKEINLVRTTVKIPGQKPRGCRGSTENSVAPQPAPNNNVSVRGKE